MSAIKIADIRHEYIDGEVFAMAHSSVRHNRSVMNIANFIYNEADAKGGNCEVYQATPAGENVVIDIYRGALNGLTGQFNFYAGYAPTTATNVLDSLLFNSKPFSLEVK